MAGSLHVVGIGGAIRDGSTSEAALAWMMAALAGDGWETTQFKGADLSFPLYDPSGATPIDAKLERFIEAVRHCDALVISSPVYHGGAPGLLKNAIDHLQPLASDRRPYLTGRSVCCIAAGGGLAGAVSTLSGLRDIVVALRGWPVPMQVPISSSLRPFEADGSCSDAKVEKLLKAAVSDLSSFARGAYVAQAAAAVSAEQAA